jgi:type VII secretion-associated serine protease mycosin
MTRPGHRLAAAALGICLALLTPATPARADNVRDAEWHLGFLDTVKAWQISQGDRVTVAVIDTGINGNHPDLSGNVLPGDSLVPGHPGDGWDDVDEHGTAMAALIAAHGHGEAGILGIAPKSKILPLQERRGAQGAHPDTVAAAISEAVQRGARVISMSIGNAAGSVALQLAIDQAEKADVVVVAAMGNTDLGTRVACPACYEGVVAVGGVDRNGNHAAVSITGPQMVVSAPAVDIASTARNNGYGVGTGTSPATAITAGVVALIRAKYPKMTAVDVIHRLTATATDKGPPGRDDQYGYGIVNPYAALTADIPSIDPTVTPSATAAPSPTQSTTSGKSGRNSTGIGIIVLFVALAVLATIGIRRAAARYRRRLHDEDES